MIRYVIILGLLAYNLSSCVVQDGNGGYYIPQPLIPPFPRVQLQPPVQQTYNNYVAPLPPQQYYRTSSVPQQRHCQSRSVIHIVRCGETISSIDYRYRVQPCQITRSYPFDCRQTIYVGDRLTINY